MPDVTVRETTLDCLVPTPGEPDPEPPLQPAPGAPGGYPSPTLAPAGPPSPRRLHAVVLEHEWLRLTFLPELGGRLARLYDQLAGTEVLAGDPAAPGGFGLGYVDDLGRPGLDEVAWEATVDDDGAGRFVAWDTDPATGLTWECAVVLAPDTAAVVTETRVANPTDLPRRYAFALSATLPVQPGSRLLGGALPQPLTELPAGAELALPSPHEGFFGVDHPALGTGLAHAADPRLVPARALLTDGTVCRLLSRPFAAGQGRWLAPGQELVQRDIWLPLRGLDGLSYAGETIAASWRADGDGLALRLLAAQVMPGCTIALGDETVRADLGPDVVTLSLRAPDAHTALRVTDGDGQVQVCRARLAAPTAAAPRPRAFRLPTPAQEGRELEWQGRHDEARAAYRAGAETEVAATAALARYALELDDAEEAHRWARRALALDEHDPAALWVCALAARLAGERHEAGLAWSALLTHGETRAAAVIALIDEALAEHDYALAADRGGHLLLEPGDFRVFGRLAHALRHLGDTEAVRSLGDALPARTDPLLAAELWLTREDDAPALSPAAKLQAVALYDRFADPDAAAALLAGETGPGGAVPPALLAYAEGYLRDEPSLELPWFDGFAAGAFAIRILRHGVQRVEGDELAHYQLGCALAAAGDWDEAAMHWAVATEGPWAAEANRNLGLMAWRIQGDLAAAAAFYRHAVAAGAGGVTLREQAELEACRQAIG